MIQIIKTEGIFGLYSGLSASILRQITYSTMRFGVYDKLKNLISNNQGKYILFFFDCTIFHKFI